MGMKKAKQPKRKKSAKKAVKKKRVDLDENSIFSRHFKAFLHVHKTFGKDDTMRDIFHEKTIQIMRDGGKRVQIAIMSYLCNKNMKNDSIMIALKMEIPRDDWNWAMKRDKKEINTAKNEVAKWKQDILKDYETAKNGFNLVEDENHIVHFVDSQDKIENLLRPFIEESAYFGFDSEFLTSYFGDAEALCLIQLSNKNETMLIDIHAFKDQLKWTDSQFLELFQLIFSHGKLIYGFDLSSDLSVLKRNFSFFAEQILPNINMVCLYETVNKIKDDENLRNLLFGGEAPKRMGLASMTEIFLGFPLDKKECTSIWNSRPLRHSQLVYAAMDSYVVVKLKKVLRKKIKQNYPEKINVVFSRVV